VKTRLVPPLDDLAAARLYRAFLVDQLAFVAGFAARAEVEWWTGGPPDPDVPTPPPPAGVVLREQGRGDLGARLGRAFARSRHDDVSCTVVVGADCPSLPAARVADAFDRLDGGAPAVLAPADDGGYVLIGMREPRPELFRDIPWGGPEVRTLTLERAAAAAVPVVELEPWYDVDDARGLERLRAWATQREAAARAPATVAWLVDWRETVVL
jgi:rSAM/selenodomain-associated transferase 1